ncbi:MAG: efflux RND transporter periplasmic adaptor subunit [Verrucomicrobiota bacterium]
MNTPESAPNAGKSEGPPPQPQPPPQGKPRYWIWGLLVCLVVVGIVISLLHRQGPAQAGQGKRGFGLPVVPVATAVVRKGDIGVYTNALGIVTPVYTVMVKSRVDGQLMSVNFVEGQMVHQGDSLVEIDPRPYQAQVVQMEGQLVRDKALLENAHIDLERYKIAYASNAIPEQQLATQVAAVHQYEGTVKLDEGQLSNAVVQLIYTHLTAPISGRIGLRPVDPGNIVHATDTNPLAVITQLQPITVVFSVTEDSLPEILQQMSQGNKLAVEAYDSVFEKKLATGTLLTTDNQIDTTTGTIRLKALFANEDNSLFPNQFVNVNLLVRTQRGVLLVPTAAVQRSPEGTFVYVVQTNQTVAMRPVKEGPTEGSVTAVEGLEEGDIIAADNFNRLQDGVKVAVGKGEEGPRDRPVQVSLGKGVKVAATNPEAGPKQGHGKKRNMAATEATPP